MKEYFSIIFVYVQPQLHIFSYTLSFRVLSNADQSVYLARQMNHSIWQWTPSTIKPRKAALWSPLQWHNIPWPAPKSYTKQRSKPITAKLIKGRNAAVYKNRRKWSNLYSPLFYWNHTNF